MINTRNLAPWLLAGCTGLWLVLQSGPANAYPLDGYESTGIGRLEAQRLVQEGMRPGRKRPPGELLPLDRVKLRLLEQPEFRLPESDPVLTRQVKKMLGSHVNRYGIALLDLSDPEHPRSPERLLGALRRLIVGLALIVVAAGVFSGQSWLLLFGVVFLVEEIVECSEVPCDHDGLPACRASAVLLALPIRTRAAGADRARSAEHTSDPAGAARPALRYVVGGHVRR